MKLALSFVALAMAQDFVETTVSTGITVSSDDYLYESTDGGLLDARKRNKNKNKYQPPVTKAPTTVTEPTTMYQATEPPKTNKPVKQSLITDVDVGAATCFQCEASSMEECAQTGTVVQCDLPRFHEVTEELQTSSVCMITLRARDGEVYAVNMGCKEREACKTQMENNFQYGFRPKLNQCSPDKTEGPSVCRQCCAENNCLGTKMNNFLLKGDSRPADWRADFLG